jgi:hypothetical protein
MARMREASSGACSAKPYSSTRSGAGVMEG